MRGSGRATDREPSRPQSATANDAPCSAGERLRCCPPATVGSGKTLGKRKFASGQSVREQVERSRFCNSLRPAAYAESAEDAVGV